MGFFYSNDGRTCTSTLDVRPTTFLTPQGERDTKAAITIQRWWRKTREHIIYERYLGENSNGLRLRHKRKHEDMESDIVEYTDTELDTDLDVEEINSSEFAESDQETETESESGREVQTIANNNFLWDLWLSFYTLILRFFGM